MSRRIDRRLGVVLVAAFGAPGATPGPDAPDSFDATLLNGRRVTPLGVSVQVGQQPLNSVLTPTVATWSPATTTNATARPVPARRSIRPT